LKDDPITSAVGNPKLILDTNLPSKLNSPAYRDDAERIMSAITSRYKIVTSPQTFYELLDTLQGGDGTHFESDKSLFRLMVGPGSVSFLRLPGAFALHKLLRLDAPVTKFGPADFRKCLRVVLHAKSREDLFEGNVRTPGAARRRLAGFQPEVVRREHIDGQRQHREYLEAVRDGRAVLQQQGQWGGDYAAMLGRRITGEQALRFAVGLDAVYTYTRTLCDLVVTSPYNFDKHRGDWIDLQQLHYLCDPDICLLTDDGDLRKRVERSSQGAQVLDFRDFLVKHGFSPRH
jgi:hypothetical protein